MVDPILGVRSEATSDGRFGRIVAVPDIERHAASFRDPAGYVFEHGGRLFRAVHPDAIEDVEALFSSGLHDELVAAGLLVAHREPEANLQLLPPGWRLLEPQRIPIISYASEWADAQLSAAGSLTLQLLRRALRHGLTLKDANTFNVQFVGSRPVFIDLLSFTRIGPNRAWPAYRQFCEHFLGPLALRRHRPAASQYHAGLTGLPMSAVSALLPRRTWLSPGLALHIHLHARADEAGRGRTRGVQAQAASRDVIAFQRRLAESLAAAVEGLAPPSRDSAWTGYRDNNIYSAAMADRKLQFVKEVAASTGARRALDLGANDGHYARALASMGIACTAVELDAACCERIYASSTAPPFDARINTVRVDLTNPTPAHGWRHEERASFTDRMRCDITLALALLHHLAITHQVPFDRIAQFLGDLAPCAIVEYVPVCDPMAQQLLAARPGLSATYLETLSEQSFQSAFARVFDGQTRREPLDGQRVLYHFRRRC